MERRRRLVTRALPLTVIAVVAFALGASAGAPGSPEKEAAERFSQAWAHKDFAAMYRELNEASRRSVGEDEFAKAYREAAEVATLRTLEVHSPGDPDSENGSDDGPGADRSRHGGLRRRRAPTSTSPMPTAASPGTRASSSPASNPASTSKTGSTWRRERRSSPATGRRSPKARPKPANTRWAAPRSTSPAKSAKPQKKTSRRSPGRASPPARRSASAASSRPSTRASPAGPAARCSRSPTKAARPGSSPRPNPRPGRR